MPVVRTSIHVDAPPDRVWGALADFGSIHRWNLGVPASHQMSTPDPGVGTTRHCDLSLPGSYIRERVVAWEPGSHYEVHIFEKKRVPMVTDLYATVGVEAEGDGSRAYFEPRYRTKAGLLGRIFDRIAIAPQYRKGGREFVAGLKHYVETGEDVTRDADLRIDDATIH